MSEHHPHPVHRDGDSPSLWRCPLCSEEIVLLGPFGQRECILCGWTGTNHPDHHVPPEPGKPTRQRPPADDRTLWE